MRLSGPTLLAALVCACGPKPAGPDAGLDGGAADAGSATCEALAPPDCNGVIPTYTELAPVFSQRCLVCHDGHVGGPWPLYSYQHLSDWQDDVRSQILNCGMPPADSGVPITLEERQAIFTWVRCGRPK